MKAIIVLGNRLNDDESLTGKALKRCEIVYKVKDIFKPDKIILTGGIANKKTNISESRAMFNYFVNDLKMNEDLFILEEESKTTTENAINSYAICSKENIDEVVVISSIEHFGRTFPKNAINCFIDEKKNYPNIKLTMYTEEN